MMLIDNWHRVDTDPPPKDGKYLCVQDVWGRPSIKLLDYALNLRKVDKYDFLYRKAGFYSYDSDYGYYEVDDITHWTNLPDLPADPRDTF